MDDLETIDKSGKPPKSRLSDAKRAYEIWQNLKLADKKSSYERARIDAAYDNEKPFSESMFANNGMDYRVNVSWGFAKSVLDTAMAGYVDIINAVQKLFKCPTRYGNPAERDELENVVEQEVSDMIRSWRDFFPTYLRLCLTFIKHGVSVAIPNDEFDWRFSATDLSDFKIPRNCKLGQENIEVAACLRYYTPTQLYHMIRDPDIAEELGYDVKQMRKAIIDSVHKSFNDNAADEWETMEKRMKANDLYYSYGAADPQLIKVVHLWVKEYDGRISEYMFNDDNQTDKFLYEKVGRFDSTYQAFVLFTYGVGTTGEYHGIRGQGHDVFSVHGALNIAYCQVLELATYGSAPTFQPRDESAMQELQFLPTGPYNLITPNVQVMKDSVAPNIANGVLPVIQNFAQLFKDRTAQYNTETLVNQGQEKTKFQMQAELGAIAKMSVASLSLFYDPFESLLREMVRRMVRKDYDISEPGGDYIIELHKRLLRRGREGSGATDRYLQAFLYLDVDRLTAMRAIGAGSEAARLVAMDRLMTMYGSLPDFGKQNALWDMCCETVGYRNAERYAIPPGENDTPTVDQSIAQLENAQLMTGDPNQSIKVLDGQNDLVHARTHIEAEMPLIEQAQTDPNMLIEIMPGLNALNQHATEHVQKLSMDPMMRDESAAFRKQIQQADEILHNALMHKQKMERQAAKAQGQLPPGPNGQPMLPGPNGAPPNGAPVGPDGQPPIDPLLAQKIRSETMYREAQMQMLNREAEAKLQRDQVAASQKLAIEDAKAAHAMIQRR